MIHMRKVLLVDDEIHVIEGLKTTIDWDSLGIGTVLTAANGQEAWEIFLRENPDLVLTDVAMPQMNGLTLARQIRERNPDIPILILSGYDEFEYARTALHLQVSRYILKPAVYTEIQAILKETLAEVEAARRGRQYNREFLSYIERSLPALREQFLYDLITSEKSRIDIDESTLRFYRLEPVVTEGGLVMSVHLYRPENERVANEKDWQLFKYSVTNMIHEIGSDANLHVLRYVDDRLFLLLVDPDETRALTVARDLGEKIVSSVNRFLGIDLNVGIGRWYGNPALYSRSRRESVETAKALDYEGCNKVGVFGDVKPAPEEFHLYCSELVKLLVESLRRSELRETLVYWRSIEDEIKRISPPVSFVQTLCVSVMSRLLLELHPDGHLLLNDLNAVVQDIYRHRTAGPILQLVEEKLRQLVRSAMDRYDEHRKAGYVDRVVQYVHEHYHENISFSALAKQLHVTRNHLSFLFKKETGVSFMTYLTQYRIRRAKELIRQNRYMIYEIAEMVGYPDAAYFSRVFKNATGMSPTEYAMDVKNEADVLQDDFSA